MRFDKRELTFTAGERVIQTLKNTGKILKASMGHNVVILKPGTALHEFEMRAVPRQPMITFPRMRHRRNSSSPTRR